MKKKELKRMAQKIADCEFIISSGEPGSPEVEEAKETIITLSGKISPEDMFLIDELVQEILENKKI